MAQPPQRQHWALGRRLPGHPDQRHRVRALPKAPDRGPVREPAVAMALLLAQQVLARGRVRRQVLAMAVRLVQVMDVKPAPAVDL